MSRNPILQYGGTYTAISDILGDKAAEHLVSVSDYTGQPEMAGRTRKNIGFLKIYLGLLGEKYNEAHIKDLERTHAVASIWLS